MWSISLSVDTLIHSLWFLSWFTWWKVVANKKGTDPRTPNFFGYIPFIVITNWSFPYSRLITGFITRIVRRVFTSRAGTLYPSGAHVFTPSVWCDSCWSVSSFLCSVFRALFTFWSLHCLSFRIQNTALVFSNVSLCYVLDVMNQHSNKEE